LLISFKPDAQAQEITKIAKTLLLAR
jgi:hypothetical protein